MLEIHKLEFVFLLVELFSCRHWQRELLQAFRIQQQVRVMYDCICVAHTYVWALSCGRDAPSVAPEII